MTTWGCPAYVLDPTLQDGKKLPRWKPRSRLGQFLGRSREHAGYIGLVRNLRTGGVSPQFNVVYDDQFTTVGSDIMRDNIPESEGFDELLKYSRTYLLDPEDLGTTKKHVEQVLDINEESKTDNTRRTKRVSLEPEGVKEVAIDVRSQKEASAAEQVSVEPTLLADPKPIKTNNPKIEPTMVGDSWYPPGTLLVPSMGEEARGKIQ